MFHSVLSSLTFFLLSFQGYFSNISEYLRVGPPLYFVVKDYNYRFINFIVLSVLVSLLSNCLLIRQLSLYYLQTEMMY